MRKTALLSLLVMVLVSSSFAAIAKDAEGPRNPLLMGLASFVIPGLGQAIQGDFEKGLTHFLIAVAIGVGGGYLAYLTPYGFITPVIVGAHLVWAIYSAVDSYQMAVEFNKTHGYSAASK